MTEQEIENARADIDQLDIEQLRCGVLLQLLHIESLKKERDALAAAAKLANAFIEWTAYGNCRADAGQIPTAAEVSAALRQAGVK